MAVPVAAHYEFAWLPIRHHSGETAKSLCPECLFRRQSSDSHRAGGLPASLRLRSLLKDFDHGKRISRRLWLGRKRRMAVSGRIVSCADGTLRRNWLPAYDERVAELLSQLVETSCFSFSPGEMKVCPSSIMKAELTTFCPISHSGSCQHRYLSPSLPAEPVVIKWEWLAQPRALGPASG